MMLYFLTGVGIGLLFNIPLWFILLSVLGRHKTDLDYLYMVTDKIAHSLNTPKEQ